MKIYFSVLIEENMFVGREEKSLEKKCMSGID